MDGDSTGLLGNSFVKVSAADTTDTEFDMGSVGIASEEKEGTIRGEGVLNDISPLTALLPLCELAVSAIGDRRSSSST